MRRNRKPDQARQILGLIASDLAKGLTVELACRKLGISLPTYYRWKRRWGGGESDPKTLQVRELEAEVKRLKTLVADLALEKQMLQEIAKKKW
jgi:putative transposase